eukprot:3558111-Rhodomonas_salina.2
MICCRHHHQPRVTRAFTIVAVCCLVPQYSMSVPAIAFRARRQIGDHHAASVRCCTRRGKHCSARLRSGRK